MPTISVGVREAKANLSKLLRQVRRGAQVLITDRGHPVGQIIPVDKKTLPLESRLKDLENNGILEPEPVRRSRSARLPPPLLLGKSIRAQELLQEDRDRL